MSNSIAFCAAVGSSSVTHIRRNAPVSLDQSAQHCTWSMKGSTALREPLAWRDKLQSFASAYDEENVGQPARGRSLAVRGRGEMVRVETLLMQAAATESGFSLGRSSGRWSGLLHRAFSVFSHAGGPQVNRVEPRTAATCITRPTVLYSHPSAPRWPERRFLRQLGRAEPGHSRPRRRDHMQSVRRPWGERRFLR